MTTAGTAPGIGETLEDSTADCCVGEAAVLEQTDRIAATLDLRLERLRHRLVLVGQRIERGGVECLRGAALGERQLAMASVAEASATLRAYPRDAGWHERSVALLDHAELHVVCAEQAAGPR